MADWRDQYREGSFRGVPFLIESHELTGGRRKEDREFAKREVGNSEDLGKKLKTFRLTMFVLGDDYFAKRDALEEAFDAEGPGVLIHPYKGRIEVQAGTYTLSETIGEQRIARFSVEFSLAGEIKFPDQVEDEISKAENAAANVAEESKNLFEQTLDTVNQAAFVIQQAADDVAVVVDTIEDSIKAVTEPVANLTFAIRNLKADINDLIQLPGELANRLESVFSDLFDEFEDDPQTAARVLGTFVGVVDTNFTPVIGDTPSKLTTQGNQDAIRNLSVDLSYSTQTRAAVAVEFASTNEALQERDVLISGIEGQLGQDSDELYQSLKDMQTALARAIPRVGTTALLEITPVKTIPALVIAHEEFEDLEKEIEIIDQNNIEHPGFVPGGDPIKVSAG